jgi:hypothetical protein
LFDIPCKTNLVQAGELSHGKDYLKAAGGFIHGFRYTARALFRILAAKAPSPTAPTAPTPSAPPATPLPPSAPPHGAWVGGETMLANVHLWVSGNVGLGGNGCNRGDFNVPSAGCEFFWFRDASVCLCTVQRLFFKKGFALFLILILGLSFSKSLSEFELEFEFEFEF